MGALAIGALFSVLGGSVAAGYETPSVSFPFGAPGAFVGGTLIVAAGPLSWAGVAAFDGHPAAAIAGVVAAVVLGALLMSHSLEPGPLTAVLTYVGLVPWLWSGVVLLGLFLD